MENELVSDIATNVEGDFYCIACKGTGEFLSNSCYRCNGKGKHNQEDRKRNFTYTLNNPHDSWVDGVKGSWALSQGIEEPTEQSIARSAYKNHEGQVLHLTPLY